MGNISVTYSTPLPFILEKAAYAVYAAETAATKRDHGRYYSEAYAFVAAARIIATSDETKNVARGISCVDTLPQHAVAWLVDFIGDEKVCRDLMGEQFVPARTRPSKEKVTA